MRILKGDGVIWVKGLLVYRRYYLKPPCQIIQAYEKSGALGLSWHFVASIFTASLAASGCVGQTGSWLCCTVAKVNNAGSSWAENDYFMAFVCLGREKRPSHCCALSGCIAGRRRFRRSTLRYAYDMAGVHCIPSLRLLSRLFPGPEANKDVRDLSQLPYDGRSGSALPS